MGWYASPPSNAQLDSWIKNDFNVLFHGRHGVGKTSMIFDAFKRANWKLGEDYLYFSAATIDPWVDLIGVPSRAISADGEEVLKLIRPESVHTKTIKAFFVDELNRSHKKVRNAMMELIQFKSINGSKFPNLKIVWGAVNPDEDNELKFDVEKLDPAQEDRFQIHVEIPYKPSEAYFAEKYSDPEMAEAVCKWWKDLPDNVKIKVTPRRLEYAIDVFRKTNDLRYVMPSEAQISTLKNAIQSGNPEKTFKQILEKGNEEEARRWLAIENNLTAVQTLICTDRSITAKSLHLISDEKLASFATKHKAVQEQMKAEPKKYAKIIRDLAENSQQKMLKEMCVRLLPFLGGNEASLAKVNVSVNSPSNLGLTKRRYNEIISNYSVFGCDIESGRSDLPVMDNDVADRSGQLLSIATDCSFASNTYERIKLLERLSSTVSLRMVSNEATTALKIIEHVVSYSSPEIIAEIATKHAVLINTVVQAWYGSYKNANTAALMAKAPYLTVNILTVAADEENTGKQLVFYKTGNERFDAIPEEPQYRNKQDIESLF